MKKILFTRSIDGFYKKNLENRGFSVLEHDFLQVVPLSSATIDINGELPFIKNLVFTSKHAVKIFFEGITSFPNLNLFSTSEATKNLIETYQVSPILSAPSAKQLAELMLEKANLSQGVHFICGNISLSHLPDMLEKQGITVKKLVVYETVKHPLSISEDFDGIVFLSLSAADAFLEKNVLTRSTSVFTLGETTAHYVRKKTDAQHIFVAEKPTISALIDLIVKKCT